MRLPAALAAVAFAIAGTSPLATAQSTVSLDAAARDTSWRELVRPAYRMAYPADWDLDSSGTMGTTLLLFSPLADSADRFRENVNLFRQDLGGTGMDLAQFTALSVSQVEAMVTDAEIVSNVTESRDGAPYQRVVYTGRQGAFDLQFEQLYWLSDGEAYILTLTTERDAFAAYRETGERILGSFALE